LWHIAWGYLWNRRFTSALTILSVALGVGLIYSVLTLREETRKRFEEEGQSFDIVVGAKGSPLQLVLSALYFMDAPTGNIRLSDFEAIEKNEDVDAAFPISLGDTYRGFRIVGTTTGLFSYTWTNPVSGEQRKPFNLAEGRLFQKPMEAVLGSTIARAEDLKVGDTFIGSHGFIELPDGVREDHVANPYTVVGILDPSGSPNDRAIFADLASVWDVHGQKHNAAEEAGGETRAGADPLEITAVLVSLQSPALRFQFVEYVNDTYNAMATIPINQIQNLYASLLGTAKSVLLSVGYLVVVISAISILIGLYLSILQRRRDLAIMRALGASAYEIVGSVLIEAFLVTVLGVAAGWVVGNLATWGVGLYLTRQYGLTIDVFTMLTNEQLAAFSVVGLVGIIAGIAPAWQAYRTDVARDLSEL
ncbi:MAG: ABC transporter permease, partial [Candidatus Hydrogenedentes bacterium]|nr:ABC transporter permease [Candidatus Hydrogenedentota bacterium]